MENYAEQVVGAMTEPTAEGGLLVKIDERQQRMVIRPGSANRLQASGWETLDKKAFEEAKAVLNKHGVAFAEGSQADCKLRWVTEMITFQDPAGNTHELVWGFKSDFIRFNSPVGVQGFVTGDQGNVVLPLAEKICRRQKVFARGDGL